MITAINGSAQQTTEKFTRVMRKESVMEILKEKIKRIRSQDNFPIWLIKEALEYYNGDEDKTVKKLIEIYRVIGDHPDVVIKKNIEKFMQEINK